MSVLYMQQKLDHDDVIKWKHLPRYWTFVRGIHRSPVNFPHKGQWRGHLIFSLICAWINSWVNNREAGDLIHHRAHYNIIVMLDGMLHFPRQRILSCGVRLWFILHLLWLHLVYEPKIHPWLITEAIGVNTSLNTWSTPIIFQRYVNLIS